MSPPQDGFVLEPITERHILTGFDSGQPSLDGWLKASALLAQRKGTARTFVMHDGNDVVTGYFSLTAHEFASADLPKSIGHGDPARVPAVMLARLAVDSSLQGRGLGRDLLGAAMEKSVDAGTAVGVRYMVIDPLNERAADFYASSGFRRLDHAAGEPLRLARKMSDIIVAVQKRNLEKAEKNHESTRVSDITDSPNELAVDIIELAKQPRSEAVAFLDSLPAPRAAAVIAELVAHVTGPAMTPPTSRVPNRPGMAG